MPLDMTLPLLPIRIAILTVDDRPDRPDDAGDLLVRRLVAAGHDLAGRAREPKDLDAVVRRLRTWVADPEIDCVISTGGTGLTARDVMPDAMAVIGDRDIPGFGELFRNLSITTVGTSALSSRACATVAADTCIFAIPGSPGGASSAWNGILRTQLDSRYRPCNLVGLMAGPARRHRSAQPTEGGSPGWTQKESVLRP